jgi:hypothetical protein
VQHSFILAENFDFHEVLPYRTEARKAEKSVGFIYDERVTNGKGDSYICVLIEVLWVYSSSTALGTAGTLTFAA